MKKVLIMATVLVFPCFCIFLFSSTPSSLAATHYVSWDNGTDESGCGRSDGAGACKSPWYSGLISQLSPGDTVIIHARADGNPYNNGTDPVIKAREGITWRAATGEAVKLSITPTWGDCNSNVPMFKPVIALYFPNSTIDGFYIWGQIVFGHDGDNCTVKNCDISGGVGARDDFISPIYIHGASRCTLESTKATGNHIYNNKIHDSCTNLATANNYCNGKPSDQCPLVMVYCEDGTIYENNEFYNSNGPGIRHKGGAWNVVGRYNFFHDISPKFAAIQGVDREPTWGPFTYYQNIFMGGLAAIGPKAIAPENSFYVYNNTIYNTDALHAWVGWHNMNFFNNIIYSTKPVIAAFSENILNANGNTTFLYDDYNDYYSAPGGSYAWDFHYVTVAHNLSEWQNLTGLDGNSITSDPGILNGSGTFSQPSDFKRSSYPANGRGGSWPSVMGAYITGKEVIGTLNGQSAVKSQSSSQGVPPPKNLGIIVAK